MNKSLRLALIWIALMPATAFAANIPVAPGESIQAAIDAAMPGDNIIVAAGQYDEALATARAGTEQQPITLRGAAGAIVTTSGRVLDVQHAYFVVENLEIDGQYGDRDAVRVGDDGDFFVLMGSEVRRSGRDCIDMGNVDGARIEQSEIHHCLQWDGERVDAHGITGASVTNLDIIGTQIHTFSGDAVQFDPGRSEPGWNNVRIIGCSFWLEPLAADENGFPAGTVPGENAIDTKTNENAPQANLTVERSVAYGFRGGLISNMAAFNIKENVRAHFDGVRVWDSEIAFRLRGATASVTNGSQTSVHNTVIRDVDTAVRYEDDIQQPIQLYHVTIGSDVGQVFDEVGAPARSLDARNLLIVDGPLPPEATSAFAGTALEFVDQNTYEPRITASFIDQGERLASVTTDIRGIERPVGEGYDPGAYEFSEAPPPPNTGRDMGVAPGADMGADGADAGEMDAGAADSGTADGPTAGDSKTSEGCCATASHSETGTPLLLAVVFVARLRRRRRIARPRFAEPT